MESFPPSVQLGKIFEKELKQHDGFSSVTNSTNSNDNNTATSPFMPAHSPHQCLGSWPVFALRLASHVRERKPSHANSFLEPCASKRWIEPRSFVC